MQMNQKLFLVLNYLDVFKTANEEALKSLGLSENELKLVLKNLSQEGLIRRTNSEWIIEESGEEMIKNYRERFLRESGRSEKFLKYCEEFERLNKEFKELVTRWQLKDEGGTLVPNDHSDPEYDFKIIEELSKVHEKTMNVLERISEIIPAFKIYAKRFEDALNLLMNGNLDYMVGKDRESYHDVWFELHESLLKISGMKRIE